MQDTYDLLRGAITKVVQAAREDNLSNKLLRKLGRYTRDAKPAIDWADPESRKKELARMVEAARLLLDAVEGRPEAKESAELLGVSTRWGASRRWRWPLRPQILSFVRRETAPRSVMGACAPCRADFGPSAGGVGCTRVDRGRECHSLAGSHHLHPRWPDYREHHHGGDGRGGCPSGAREVGAPLTPRQRVILPYRG